MGELLDEVRKVAPEWTFHYMTEEMHLEVIMVHGCDPSTDEGTLWIDWIESVWGFLCSRWPGFLPMPSYGAYCRVPSGCDRAERDCSYIIHELIDLHDHLRTLKEGEGDDDA